MISAFHKISKKKKFILIRASFKKGPTALLKQLYFSFADTALRRKYLVFHLNVNENPIYLSGDQDDCRLLKIDNWNDLPKPLQIRLNNSAENIEWGNVKFFERGRELWALYIKGEIAVLGWLGFADIESDFIWPVPKAAEILHQITVLPEFRGKGLQALHHKMLMIERSKSGVEDFYIGCHEYNRTSRKNILRLGFRQIGHSCRSHVTKRLTFHPNAS